VYPVQSEVEPYSVTLTLGAWLTTTFVTFDIAVHVPHVTATAYEYDPGFNPSGTWYVEPVAPAIAVLLRYH
jgi:hypothetical protein